MSSTATTAIARFNDAIDLSYREIANEVPEALVPDSERVYIERDYTSANAVTGSTTTIRATTDLWVLRFSQTIARFHTSYINDADGIFWIEVQTSDGNWHARRCREFFTGDAGSADAGAPLVSIDRQWRNTSDTGMTFRLFEPNFYTRDDVIKILDGRIYDATGGQMIALDSSSFRYDERVDYQGSGNARPEEFYRVEREQIDAPTLAPTVAQNQDALWVGPQPRGEFQYAFTYCWGYRNVHLRQPGGLLEPMFESGPSPVSVAVTTTGGSIAVTTPRIDTMLNFGVVGTNRIGHSGLYKRIYRRRNSVVAGGSLNTNIEFPAIYFAINDVGGNTDAYTDTGADVPDYFRRLPESTGYYPWAATPHQDANYVIDLRVWRRPRSLENDQDTFQISAECVDALFERALYHLCLLDSDNEAAALHLIRSGERVAQFRSRHANPARVIRARPWGDTLSVTERRRRVARFDI